MLHYYIFCLLVLSGSGLGFQLLERDCVSAPLSTPFETSHQRWHQRWSNLTTATATSFGYRPTQTETIITPTIYITVGEAGTLEFSPTSVNAEIGTMLRFNFLGLNHTLTQSQLEHPCKRTTGFDTGFNQFNPKNISGKFLVDFYIKSAKAQWFYCAQESPKSHCKAGMVFSVNAKGEAGQFSYNAKNTNLTQWMLSNSSCALYSSTINATITSLLNASTGRLSSNIVRPTTSALISPPITAVKSSGYNTYKESSFKVIAFFFLATFHVFCY